MTPALKCVGCGKRPHQIAEYVDMASEESEMGFPITPEQYVWEEEGTLNQDTGEFACTSCYIAMGQPTAPGGWTP